MTTLKKSLYLFGLSFFFLIYLPLFHSPFYMPKAITLFLSTLTISLLFFFKRSIYFPSWIVIFWFFSGLLLMGISLLSSSNYYDSIFQIAIFTSSFIVFLAFVNQKTDTPLFKNYPPVPFLLFSIGVIQGFIALCQFIFNNFVHRPDTLVKSIGLIGNPEFLATFLGVSFFMGLSLPPLQKGATKDIIISAFSTKKTALASSKVAWKTLSLWTGISTIFLGILTTTNKGTLLFIFFYSVYILAKKQKWFAVIVSFIFFLISLVTFLPHVVLSLQSRLFLWIVSGWMMLNRPFTGVGIGQFGNNYADMVFDLFQRFPFLSLLFGSFANMVSHAHQIFLHFGSELGFLGLVWVCALLIYTLKHILKDNNYYAMALFLLIIKSLYTVVFSSLTGAVLWALLLSELVKRYPPKTIIFTLYSKTAITTILIIISCFSIQLCLSDYYYLKGRKSLARHQLVKAEEHFIGALNKHPGHANSALSLAYIGYLQGNTYKMDYYISASHHLYQNLNSVLLESDMRFYLRQYDRVKPLLEYLIVAFPERMGPRIKLALVELQLGNKKRARQLAVSVETMRPRITHPIHDTYRSLSDSIQILEE